MEKIKINHEDFHQFLVDFLKGEKYRYLRFGQAFCNEFHIIYQPVFATDDNKLVFRFIEESVQFTA
jgi:hypothetical protein